MIKLLEYIEESKTWVCPKSGIWKVICVGAGGTGHASVSSGGTTATLDGISGGATSFGTYCSAAGGQGGSESICLSSLNNTTESAGLNGFIGDLSRYADSAKRYNGNMTVNVFYTGLGYGASGGAKSTSKSAPGCPGKLKTTILNIEQGTSVPCTIGVSSNTITESAIGTSYCGTNGVIIVQYIGEM